MTNPTGLDNASRQTLEKALQDNVLPSNLLVRLGVRRVQLIWLKSALNIAIYLFLIGVGLCIVWLFHMQQTWESGRFIIILVGVATIIYFLVLLHHSYRRSNLNDRIDKILQTYDVINKHIEENS